MNANSIVQIIKESKRKRVECLEITSKFLILSVPPSKIHCISKAIIVHLDDDWKIPFSQIERIENPCHLR
jgi:hypothetical protein